MIRVTVELVSAVSPDRSRKLGVIEIANDGTGTEDCGHYNGTLRAEYCLTRQGRVTHFNRRKLSVMSLVGAFLKLWGHTGHPPSKMSK